MLGQSLHNLDHQTFGFERPVSGHDFTTFL